MKNTGFPEFLDSEQFKNMYGAYVSVNTFTEYKTHRHSFYEFEYIFDGETECNINGKSYKIARGDAVFITPLDVHSYKSLNSVSVKTVTVHFNQDNLSSELRAVSDIPACTFHCSEELKAAFTSISKENESDFSSYIAIRNLIERIVILFLRSKRTSTVMPFAAEISYALGYINKNFGNPIDLKTISRKCGYSPSHFCRQFKRYTGINFIDYLTGVRLSHAKNMLADKNVNITQLCYECGFGSVRNFSRAFAKKFGCTPNEYRKSKYIL